MLADHALWRPPDQRQNCPSLRASLVRSPGTKSCKYIRLKKNRGLTGGVVVMTTDVRSLAAVDSDWELLANLRPKLVLRSSSPSLFSEVSYPHPWRAFKLLKREEVYNFDVMKCKRRYLGKRLQVSILHRVLIFYCYNIRAVGL